MTSWLLIAWLVLPHQASQPSLAPVATEPRVVDLVSPATSESAFPHVVSDGNGGVYMTWLETLPGSAGHRLRLSRLKAGAEAWDAPVTIEEGRTFWRNWADFPGVGVFPDGALMVHWLARSGEGTYHYDIRARISRNGGSTWGDSFLVNTDGRQAEHGFVSYVTTERGLGVMWLDGRDTAGSSTHGEDHASTGAMTLRYAEFQSDGTRLLEKLLDARVCDCCQTAITRTAKGPLGAFRDRAGDEVRDISFVRPAAPAGDPREFSKDGWKIAACPVNGPALASSGPSVAAAWFTTAGGKARVRAALSKDDGETFGATADLDTAFPIGRVDVAFLPSGRALVTWIGRSREGGLLRGALIDPQGNAGTPFKIAPVSIERAAGFPRIEAVNDSIIVAWTEITGKTPDGQGPPPSRVRTARLWVN